ncbi:MAG TPA: radical SAM protein [Candidatus Sabulitectum sp.]|nr:radical SAM protein [Candidatus Sabulitectum sp.]
MRRTITTALGVWRRKGPLWPLRAAVCAAGGMMSGSARGLMVEPSRGCTGHCSGCPVQEDPLRLTPQRFEAFLMSRGARPVTIHFAGKHSDPLDSPFLPELVSIASRRSAMVSVSTIGLGLRPGWEHLPVDRWIVSVPAAGEDSWKALRGTCRLEELKENLRRLTGTGEVMVELILTLWKPSAGDGEAFRRLARECGVKSIRTVFGRYDPEGYHLGRVENLALEHPHSPYSLENGQVRLKGVPGRCPVAGAVFLDASGVMNPCPFTGDPGASEAEMERKKALRSYESCAYCP